MARPIRALVIILLAFWDLVVSPAEVIQLIAPIIKYMIKAMPAIRVIKPITLDRTLARLKERLSEPEKA